jgi:thioredoxin-like negative regulator of GroEL
MTIPTILVFKDGVEVERFVGVRPKDDLADAVTKNL